MDVTTQRYAIWALLLMVLGTYLVLTESHEPMTHRHAHLPDIHHRHGH